MSTFKKILVMCDPALQITPALRRGIELARRAQAELHLYIFDFHPLIEATAELVHPDVMRLARAQFIEERLRWLTHESAGLAGDGLRVECDVVWAPALHEAVLARLLDTGATLLIKDLRLELGLKRHFLPPVDSRVIRYCPVPLMLVHPGSAQLPKRIAAAVDSSTGQEDPQHLNEAVAARALEMGLYTDAEVHVAHAFPYRPPLTTPYRMLDAVYAEIRQMDTDAFNQFAHSQQVPADRRHLLEGDPVTSLTAFAQQARMNMIVAGSLYRSTVDRLFLGSTAEALMSRAPCDLLLVKPANFLQELGRHLDLVRICRAHGVEWSAPVPGKVAA